jgi:hypothetical protein
MTGCVFPQYHCQFYDFFQTTRHSRPDVSDTICWKQLAGLSLATLILSDLARPTQSSTVSQTIPLEKRPDDLDDFSMPQVDFEMGNHKPQDPQAILGLAKLLTKLRELLQLNLQSQLILAEAEEFTLCQGRWPNPHHSGTSFVHQSCIIWLTCQLQPAMKHLKTYSTTITLTYKNVCEIQLPSMLRCWVTSCTMTRNFNSQMQSNLPMP